MSNSRPRNESSPTPIRGESRTFNSSGVANTTLSVYVHNVVTLSLAFAISGLAIAGSAYLMSGWLRGRPNATIEILPTAYGAIGPGEAWGVVIEAIIVSFETTAIGSALLGGVALLTVEQMRGVETNFADAMLRGIQHYGRIFAGSLLVFFLPTVLLTLPFLLFALGLGYDRFFPSIALVAAGCAIIIGLLIQVSLLLFLPIVVLEGARSQDGLRRSWTMTKGRRGIVFGSLLLLAVAQLVVRLGASLPNAILPNPYSQILGQVIFGGITGSWIAIASGIIYARLASQ